MELAREEGHRLIVCEGGPHLVAQLLQAGLLDELFLTIAPQVAGRADTAPRLALVEALAFTPETAPWTRLVGIRRAGGHLFQRYRL